MFRTLRDSQLSQELVQTAVNKDVAQIYSRGSAWNAAEKLDPLVAGLM